MTRKFEIVKQVQLNPDVISVKTNQIEFVELCDGNIVSFKFDDDKDCLISIDNYCFSYDALLELRSLVDALVKYRKEL